MALRSPALWMGNPAVQHTAQNDRLLLSSLLRPETGQNASTRPLTGLPGVLHGPDGTMGEVTLLSNTQFTVNPARWMVPSSASALGGTYEVTNDAVSTLAVTAQNATQFRRSYWGVWVIDSFVAGSGDDLPHWGLVDGALAASSAAAALPSAGSLPANFLALGEFLIPPVGQSVTYTPYDARTGLRGGILPVTSTDTRNGASDGQYRDHPTWGLERWSLSKGLWIPQGSFIGSTTCTLTSGSGTAGAQAFYTTAAITAKAGQRLRLRWGWSVSPSAAVAQTAQVVSMQVITGSATILNYTNPGWRQPAASDVTNWEIVTSVIVDVTATGTITLRAGIQVGTGGASLTFGILPIHYDLGVPAP